MKLTFRFTKQQLLSMVIACAFFMYSLDITIVATALPNIAQTFHTNPVHLSVAITAYIVSLAVFIPISGWMSDRYGARTVFASAIFVFTASSVLCGLSNSLPELTLTRALQGMGGAMMIPVGRLVVLRSVPKSQYVKAMMAILIPAQLGPILGPVVGGFFTTYLSWRWIFLMNAPIGVIGFICALLFVENYREGERHPFDWLGFLLSALCLSSLMCGLESIGRGIVSWQVTVLLFGAGTVFGILLIRHSRNKAHALIDFSLLRIQTFRINVSAGSFYRLGFGTVPFLLPLLFQVAFGMTAFASGLLTFASALGAVGSRAVLTRLLKSFGYRNILVVNAVIFAITLLGLASLKATTPVWCTILIIFVSGVARMCQNNCLNTLAYADVPSPRMSTATSLAQLAQQFGQAIGVAMAALALQITMGLHGESHLSRDDIQITFILIALLTLGSLPELLRLPTNAGEEISGRKSAAGGAA